MVAFDQDTTRWALSTNPSCAGWASTSANDGTPLVIALNADARVEDGSLAETTFASAVTASTGKPRWEHVPVIGPVSRDGMIFTGAPKAVISADPYDTTTLTPDTGTPPRLPAGWAGADVIHEHHGNTVLATGTRIGELDGDTGTLRWEHPTPGALDPGLTSGHLLTFTATDTPAAQTILHLHTGEPVGSFTTITSTTGCAEGGLTAVTGMTDAGPSVALLDQAGIVWEQLVEDTHTRVTAVDQVEVFLDTNDGTVALSSVDGSERSRGAFRPPVTITTTGYALIPDPTPDLYEVIRLDRP